MLYDKEWNTDTDSESAPCRMFSSVNRIFSAGRINTYLPQTPRRKRFYSHTLSHYPPRLVRILLKSEFEKFSNCYICKFDNHFEIRIRLRYDYSHAHRPFGPIYRHSRISHHRVIPSHSHQGGIPLGNRMLVDLFDCGHRRHRGFALHK